MAKRSDTEHLMNELAHLSGLTREVIGEEVDWFGAELASITGDAPQLQEGSKAKLAAQRETIKGELETLAKRMGGVLEMVDNGKADQAAVSLEKILADGAKILERLPKAKAPEKPKPKPQAQVTQPGQDQGGEPKGPGAPQPDERKEVGAPSAKANEALFVDGYLVTEEEQRDPFGFGQGLIDSVKGALGLGKRGR